METGKIWDHVKQMEITLCDHKFKGTDPIALLKLVQEYVRECDTF